MPERARRQWLAPHCFARQEEIGFRDCDPRGRLRLGPLLNLLISAAEYDFAARGLTTARLYELRQVLLVSCIALRVRRCPLLEQTVTVSTWEEGVQGIRALRNFTVEDGAGVCVSARSEWVVVDPTDRRVLRAGDFAGKRLETAGREVDCPPCRRLALPREGAEELGRRRVLPSELDRNGHLFSANYGEVLFDCLPPELRAAELRECVLRYHRETVLGEELCVTGVRQGGTLLAEGSAGGERRFSCACVFAAE